MGFLRDIDDVFLCNDAGFHEETYDSDLLVDANRFPPLKDSERRKGFALGIRLG